MSGTATVSAPPAKFQRVGQAMSHPNHPTSSVEYGRKLLSSALEGARYGGETYLHGKPLNPFLAESVRGALKPAIVGLCVSLLGCCSAKRRSSASRAIAYGLIGGVVGFGASIVWRSRLLAASVASGAMHSVSRARDEHWLEQNPIDYA
ncbi:MAG TPA: hypothetical protein VEG30_06090 [Terriglobales bacterium]|nr:hypothetical protein [Terriglobales bacterium]